jgi:hypothetical protein
MIPTEMSGTEPTLTREDVRQIVLEELSKLGDILPLMDAAKETLSQEESTNG